jgi:hypothetical protein
MTTTFANQNGLKEDSLEYAIHNVQDNYKGQELNGTCQLKGSTHNTHLFGKKTEHRHSTDIRSWSRRNADNVWTSVSSCLATIIRG